MSGELAPGQKMSLRSVAETLGVSIMPVREAVARLVVGPVPGGTAQSRGARPADEPRALPGTDGRQARGRGLCGGGGSAQPCGRRPRRHAAVRRGVSGRGPKLRTRRPTRLSGPTRNSTSPSTRATGLPTLVGIIEGLWLKIGPVLNFDLKISPGRLANGRRSRSSTVVSSLRWRPVTERRTPGARRTTLREPPASSRAPDVCWIRPMPSSGSHHKTSGAECCRPD